MGMLTGVGAKPEEREAADEDGGEDFRYGRGRGVRLEYGSEKNSRINLMRADCNMFFHIR